ncbi:MAG: hypothetical protein JWR16_1596 [Nevskia sp.]|nr:hypothetical protein [Nevskia sp.]
MKAVLKLALAAVLTVFAQTGRAADAALPEVFQHPATAQELATLLSAVGKTTRAAAALRGNFIQRKYLHELPQPLLSSGQFLVARGAGVDWHTQKPFDAAVLLTPQALIQRGADGKQQRVDASQQPGLAAVAQVFDALFALDIDKLGQSFTLFGQKDGKDAGAWLLGLTPREPAFAKVIARIVVSGATEPKLITLFEASGDRTEIELAGVSAQAALADADRQRFQ